MATLGEDELITDDKNPGRARIRKGDDNSLKMFEPLADGPLPIECPAAHYNNVTVSFSENTNITQAAVVSGKAVISTVSWDPKMEKIKNSRVEVRTNGTTELPTVLQVKLVTPSTRNAPLMVVCSTAGAHIFDTSAQRAILSFNPIENGAPAKSGEKKKRGFCRGVSCVDNTILVGTSFGTIMTFNCSGATSVAIKKNLSEHKGPISDIATCKFDELTVSADSTGNIIVWSKQCKSASKRISTDNDITVINVLRKQVLVGCIYGQIHIYSAVSGTLMCSVSAHARCVTGISVAPESAYVLTCSEDSSVRVFKLHTRKPEAYQLEFRYGDEIDDRMLVGAQFANDRGSSMVFAAYDVANLMLYKIYKKIVKDPI